MSILKTIGFALIGKQALADIKAEVVALTTATVKAEEAAKPLEKRFSSKEREQFLADALYSPARGNQLAAGLLTIITGGDIATSLALTNAARDAELTGAGFMKKKSQVHQQAKLIGMTKADTNLAVELAVRLSK